MSALILDCTTIQQQAAIWFL